jgi:beta-glucanase (GH16 family)
MKPHKKTELLKGNLLDHWEYEVNNFGGGNQERQMYVDSPEFADMDYSQWAPGELRITAKRKETNICGHVMPYTSARIRTKRRFDFCYGRLSFWASVPQAKGIWPAVWMLPTDNAYGPWPASGEIDILEARNDERDTVYQAVHYGKSWDKRKMKSKQVIHGAYPGIYQCYSLGWDATGISWWVNGFETFSVEMARPFDQKFHLIINLAVGGAFCGMEPDPDWQQSDFRIHDLVVETPV